MTARPMARNGRHGGAGGALQAPAPFPQPLPPTGSEAPVSASLTAVWRGRELRLTIRGASGADVLPRMADALAWLDADNDAQRPTEPAGYVPEPGSPPICPDHGTPMKASKFGGGWYCPRRVAGGHCQREASADGVVG